MTKKLVFAFPDDVSLTELMVQTKGSGLRMGRWTWRRFPDGESLVRVEEAVDGCDVVIVCTLSQPDTRFLPLCFLAETLRELGAARVVLVAPYLGYMRQDKRFHSGEAVTAHLFASMLSPHIDWLITVDPHLHRIHALEEIYTVPSVVVSAVPVMAQWIHAHVQRPFIIGPDEESEQWVKEVADRASAPFVVLSKERKGDREVQITLPANLSLEGHTPVLVDDIISSAHTMAEVLTKLRAYSEVPPICVGVHGIFAGDSNTLLQQAGAGRVVTCNTIAHPSNAIDLSAVLVEAMGRVI